MHERSWKEIYPSVLHMVLNSFFPRAARRVPPDPGLVRPVAIARSSAAARVLALQTIERRFREEAHQVGN